MGSMFLAGFIFLIIGIALNGTLLSYNLGIGRNQDYTNSSITLNENDAEQVHKLDFKLSGGVYNIKKGESFSISGNGYYQSSLANETWQIKTKRPSLILRVLSHAIEIPVIENFFYPNDSYSNTITLPEKEFREITVKCGAGSVNAEQLQASEIQIKTGAGEFLCNSIIAENLSIKTGAGDSDIQNIQATNSCTVKLGVGDTSLGSEKSTASNLIHNLTLKNGVGSADVHGKLTGENRISCSLGDIDLTLAGYRSNYTITSHSVMGDINYENDDDDGDDGDWDDEHITGNTHHNAGDIYGTISIDSALSDVDINFMP